MNIPRRRNQVVLYTLLVLMCALPVLTLFSRDELGRPNVNRCVMATPDEPSYLLIAKSIASGHGISTVALVGKDTFYPPGLPLVLAGWGKVFGFSIESMHVCVALTLSAAVAMAFVLVRRILTLWRWTRPGWGALLATALFATSYHVLEDALFIFSEPLFMLLVLAWLYAALRMERWPARPAAAIVVTLLAVAVTMTRAAGVVCFATTILWVVVGLAGRRPDAVKTKLGTRLATLGCVLGVIFAYYATVHVLSPEKSIASGADSNNSYTRQLIGGLGFDLDPQTGKLRDNLLHVTAYGPRVFRAVTRLAAEHVQDFAASLVPPYREADELVRGDLYPRLARLLLLLAGVGWLARLIWPGATKTRFVELFVLAYIGLYLIWPFRMVRFWIPLLPLLAAYTADLLRLDGRGFARQVRWTRVHAALCLVLGGLLLALNAQEIALKLPWFQMRLNYVSDALASSARTIRAASPDPAKTIVCLDDEAFFVFSWYLNPGASDSGYRVHSAKRGERIEAMILRNLEAVKADPAKRLFVTSYFGHDPRQGGEPTMLLVMQNLQKENPGMFVPSDPDRIGFTPLAPPKPGRWKIVKLQQDWNTTAVWEICPAR